jgi:hypothetical protein
VSGIDHLWQSGVGKQESGFRDRTTCWLPRRVQGGGAAEGRLQYVFICIIAGAGEQPQFSATSRLALKPLGSNGLAKCHTAIRRYRMTVPQVSQKSARKVAKGQRAQRRNGDNSGAHNRNWFRRPWGVCDGGGCCSADEGRTRRTQGGDGRVESPELRVESRKGFMCFGDAGGSYRRRSCLLATARRSCLLATARRSMTANRRRAGRTRIGSREDCE